MFRLRLAGFAAGTEHVVLADHELLGGVFSTSAELMRTGQANLVVEPVAGSRSLPLLDGEEHLRLRRLLSPVFSGRGVLDQQATMQSIAVRHIDAWPRDRNFAVHERLQSLTLDVILEVLFGREDEDLMVKLRAAVPQVLRIGSRVGLLPQLRLKLGPRTLAGRFHAALEQCDAAIYELIRRRRARTAETGDAIGTLLSASDGEGGAASDGYVRDQLMALLVAGHETSATTLAWAFHELAHRPDQAEIARRECAAGERTRRDAIVRETLRLYPVVPFVMRKTSGEFELDGYVIPGGTIIMCCMYLAQRDGATFPDPTSFRPERFLSPEDPRSGQQRAWMPFGGGVRRCLGGSFAMAEVSMVLEQALERLRFRPAGRHPERVQRRGVWIAPESGARLIATPA